MIARITGEIAIDEKVKFVPKKPGYLTIWNDKTGILCSARGEFVEEGEVPLRCEMENVRVLYAEPRDILAPIYYRLAFERERQQKQRYDPFEMDLEPIPYFDTIDDDLF